MRRNAEITPPTIAVNTSFNPFGNSAPTSDRSMNLRGWFDRNSAQVSGWQDLLEVATQIEKKEEQQVLLHAGEEEITFIQQARKYILCSSAKCLWIMDQQRAHQRVLFEQFREQLLTGKGHSQQLLFPEQITLSVSQWAIFNECKEDLHALGYVVSGEGREHMTITGVPVECGNEESGTLFLHILDGLAEGEPSTSARQEKIAWDLAFRSSIKTGQMLTTPEMETLFQQLMRCNQPYYWRNEKPTLIHYENHKLDEYFK